MSKANYDRLVVEMAMTIPSTCTVTNAGVTNFTGVNTHTGAETHSGAETFQVIAASAKAAPTVATGATATAQTAFLTLTGGVGGDTSIATTGTGGIGGGVVLTSGAGAIASAAATAATGGAGGALVSTTGAGGAEAVATVTSTGGAGGAFTHTTGAGGAVSGAVSGTATGGASGAVALASGVGGAVTATTGTNVGGASGNVSFVSGVGGAASGATDTGGASGTVTIGSGAGGAGDTGGASGNVTIQTGAAGAGGSPAVGVVIVSPGTSEKWRFTAAGVLNSLATIPSNAATADGAVLATGGLAFTDVANAWIDDSTQGSGTVTHYIGNQTITTSSDARLKKDIVSTERDVDAMLMSLRPVDFTWDDPTDRDSLYGKHSRGRYMGFIAQEMVKVAPWAVNAPNKECVFCKSGEVCEDHKGQYWFAEYDGLVAPLVKAYQDSRKREISLMARIEALEAKFAK